MRFPGGKRFAFTILDDTDDSTLENVRPVYDRLREHGLRITKTVWPLACPEGSRLFFAADTLARPEYLAFAHELASDGFELAFHAATMESSLRERTAEGLRIFEREFGHAPRVHANHGFNRENLYWGWKRFRSPPLRWLSRIRGGDAFAGECEDSPYFWGDLCRDQVRYVRNFTFRQLDMMAVNPEMPYQLASTPYVAHWFSTSDAPDAAAFRRTITPVALDRLEATGGVCILSTHLGKGFAAAGRLDPAVDAALADLAARPGWFAPVSEILDHLKARRADRSLGGLALLRLELRFLRERLAHR